MTHDPVFRALGDYHPPEMCDEALEKLCYIMHDDIVDFSTLDITDTPSLKSLFEDVAAIYKTFSVSKFGTRSNAKHYIALAYLLAEARRISGESKVAGFKISQKNFISVINKLLDAFRKNPC